MYLKQSEHEYFGRPLNFISPSDIKKVKTPAEFYYFKYIENEEQKEARETKATILGKLAHMIIAREKVEDKFWVFKKPYPDRTMNLTENKQALARQEAENIGKEKVEEVDYLNIIELARHVTDYISDSLIYNPNAIIEHSFYAKIIFSREDGVFQKVENIKDFAELEADKKDLKYIIITICTKPDYVLPEMLNMDFKTCVSAYPEKFAKDAYQMGYPVQAAMGLDITSAVLGSEIDTFLFLALEKKPPYLGALFDANDYIEYGRSVYRKRLLNIYRYAKKNYWPGYSIFSPSDVESDTEQNKPIPLWLPTYATPVDQIKF